ncbi:unnamed protein product, partial [Lepidochelys olivacea]
FCTYMFYIRLVTYRVWIKKGQKLGVMLPMQSVYPGMISHAQIYFCDISRYKLTV